LTIYVGFSLMHVHFDTFTGSWSNSRGC